MFQMGSYTTGDEVEVWSNGQQAWNLGLVLEAPVVDCVIDGYAIPTGALKVQSPAGTKWILPDQIATSVRRPLSGVPAAPSSPRTSRPSVVGGATSAATAAGRCKQPGCGRPVQPGLTRGMKSFDTCCKRCVTSGGSGEHDANCGGAAPSGAAARKSSVLPDPRESADNLVTSAFRRVAKKVHPDKGGKLVDSQRLLAARQVWEDALRAASANGRPVSGKSSATSSSQFYLSWGAESRREFRIQSEAALLTYQGFNGLDHWRRFVSFVASSFKRWRVKHWCATLETNTDGTDHAHLMLQFTQVVDRTTRSFIFEGLRPNVATTDLGGEGFCKKRMQQSINRGMFYVWANKVGTQLDETGAQCLAGNYGPVWSTAPFRYQVLRAWPELQESADNLVTSAFRRVAKKVHPDKGGKLVDSQRLLAARQVWEDALRAASANGRPVSGKSSATSSSQFYLSWGAESRREFRIQSEAALLTYQGFNGLDHWRRFVSFVASSFKRWRVKHWCATLETNTDGTDHAHLMLQFTQVVDRTTRSFIFEGLRPNVATTDLGGEGFCKKRMQQSINRGMFYVWANKVGTQLDETGAQCLAGNYGPVWSTAPFRYQVLRLAGTAEAFSLESADNLVTSAFRRVAKKVHPDKGGKLVDSQRLLAARQVWEDALRAASANGRPVSGKSSATSSSQFYLSWGAESRREFRIQSEAALLTYQGFNGLDHWRRFVSFVASSFKRWRVKHWCATLETNTDGTDHAHLMLQFTQVVDRTTRSFIFEGLRPNVATTDLGGEGFCKKRMQQSINRGMFYVWANKVGTQLDETGAQCLAGNYGPVWSTAPFRYQVLRAWPELQESADNLVTSAFRRVAKKVHPDKGGKLVDSQRLLAARQVWEDALRAASANGRPVSGKSSATSSSQFYLSWGAESRREFRIQSEAALLTYQGFNDHAHLMLQFTQVVDRTTRSFIFEGLRPNVATTDLGGEGFCKKRMQQSINRGMFYVWANKVGTQLDETGAQCLAGNYGPVWSTAPFRYQVLGAWPELQKPLVWSLLITWSLQLGGEGFCKKRMQQSINRGMFYVWANKVGTQLDETGAQCLAGNYGPVWSTAPFRYQVLRAWPELQESADNLVTSAFRRVAKKVHPDKGGKLVDSQRLLAARQVWEDALRAASSNGRPVSGKSSATSSSQFYLSWGAESRREFRIQSEAALLTYQGFNDHAHLMLQFTQVVDRTTRSFIFEGLRPNVATTDLGGEGFCKKRMQQSINRGMFYVWANKVGTQLDETGAQCLAGNYGPVWSTAPFRYQVLGAWPELQESADNLVTSAFRRVAKKVHPDKGGKLVDSQRLLAARQVWEDALRAASANGRPVSGKSSATSSSQFYLSWGAESRRECRIQSEAALLTYQGFNGLDHWRRFVSFVASSFKRWRVKHWCATLETNTDGTDHVHLMLQFPQVVDRTTRSFIFEGLRPNVATTDLGGEGFCKKRMQQSINRGMFYVWANKVGTQLDETGAQCLAGNYGPVWSTAPFRYQVLGAWPELQESADNLVTSAFRRVAKKVHPDKGGKLVDSQRLLAARQVWEDALRAASANGRPVSGKSSATSSSQFYLSWGAESRREFRIQSEAALLTYQGFNGLDHWRRFVSFVASSFKRWRVKHWCATLETNTDGTDHAHLMLQFTQVVDRTTRSFIFEGLRPNVATTDLGGEGFCKKRMQQSINRGMFYVWANKVGTQLDETGAQCLAGNYGPVWSTAPFRYQVLGAWPEL
ncbi:unnamed protein product, partial [Polarella glacialis]